MNLSIETIPEELLIKIISLLNFKEAVKTSILSHSWRHLWKHIPNLVIDANNVLSLETNDILTTDWKYEFTTWKRVSLKIITEFVNNANFVLRSHQGSLDSLILKFFLDQRHESYLDTWISIVLASRPKKIVLDMQSACEKPYKFPCHLFSSNKGGQCFLEFLELNTCNLDLPIKDFDGFKNLKTLSLEIVDITDSTIQNLLPNCSSLEDLHLDSCNLLLNLKIPRSLDKLKDLKVILCDKLINIECHAPYLSSFTYSGDEILLDVKTLEIATIYLQPDYSTTSYVITDLPRAIASVKTLELQMEWALEDIPNLHRRFLHLRHLYLTNIRMNAIYSVTTLVEVAPFLETFAIELWGAKFVRRSKKIGTVPERPHKQLRTVEMIGFTGYKDQLELLSFLLVNATRLERMTINTSSRTSKHGCEIRVSHFMVKTAKKLFTKHLHHLVPEHVKLLFL